MFFAHLSYAYKIPLGNTMFCTPICLHTLCYFRLQLTHQKKIILLLFITTKEFLQRHFLLRQSETVSINPLEFLINFLFIPWLFSLELLHLWIMDKVRTIAECFYTAKRRLDRNYS